MRSYTVLHFDIEDAALPLVRDLDPRLFRVVEGNTAARAGNRPLVRWYPASTVNIPCVDGLRHCGVVIEARTEVPAHVARRRVIAEVQSSPMDRRSLDAGVPTQPAKLT